MRIGYRPVPKISGPVCIRAGPAITAPAYAVSGKGFR